MNFDYQGFFFDFNYGGCAALESASNDACAAAVEQLAECTLQACGVVPGCAMATQAQYDACLKMAEGTGGACATEANAESACAADFADGGVLNGGKCSTGSDVLNVFCGTGP